MARDWGKFLGRIRNRLGGDQPSPPTLPLPAPEAAGATAIALACASGSSDSLASGGPVSADPSTSSQQVAAARRLSLYERLDSGDLVRVLVQRDNQIAALKVQLRAARTAMNKHKAAHRALVLRSQPPDNPDAQFMVEFQGTGQIQPHLTARGLRECGRKRLGRHRAREHQWGHRDQVGVVVGVDSDCELPGLSQGVGASRLLPAS